jgi:hypothetical protein
LEIRILRLHDDVLLSCVLRAARKEGLPQERGALEARSLSPAIARRSRIMA